jgi:hypothetical protein
MAKAKRAKDGGTSGAVLGFEEKLWLAADKLRGSMDAAEYKHVVLGLIFLEYISDASCPPSTPPRRPSSARTPLSRTRPLPRLLSGEVRVRDAVRLAERTL